jgi:hypothetical protein
MHMLTTQDDSKLFRENRLKRLWHQLCSHDIFRLDFCLFGKVKGTLIVREIPDEIGLLEAVSEILNGISDVELPRPFGVGLNMRKG